MLYIFFAAKMDEMADSWEPNNPETLYRLCVQFCVVKIEIIANCDCEAADCLSRRDGVSLPLQVCEDLLNAYRESEAVVDDRFVHIFDDPVNMPLRRINVSGTDITELGLKVLMAHKPMELNINGCHSLSWSAGSLDIINVYGSNLTTLHLGNNVKMFECSDHLADCIYVAQNGINTVSRQVFECPKLRALSIHNLEDKVYEATDILHAVLMPLKTLTHLDLTRCSVKVESLHALEQLNKLVSLVVCDLPIHNLFEAFNIIAKLQKLR